MLSTSARLGNSGLPGDHNSALLECRMIALRVAGRAIPLYWELLDHRGSRDVETQKILLNRVLPLFADYTKVILGGRQGRAFSKRKFCGVDLARWLKQQKNTYSCLRLKKDEYVEREKDI